MHKLFILPALFVLAIGAESIAVSAHAADRVKDLRIAVVDADGGAAALFVTPEGKSLLIDAGWPPGMGNFGASPAAPKPSSTADRIAAAAASLGVKKIDYLLMTHYHVDHAGGLDALLEKLPVDTFIDHGPNREATPPDENPRKAAIDPDKMYPHWVAAIAGQHHITAQVGQVLHIGSLNVEFVTSDGHVPDSPLPGAGQPNPLCAGVPQMERDGGEENVRSLGMLITFGKTRILDLGDLTWNKELELLCPVNKVGKVDVYFVTGHGMDISSSPPTAAFDPLVALMQNGRRKGGDEAVFKTLKTFPDLQGLWLDHYSARYPDLNPDPNTIANLDPQPDMAYPINLDITPAGKITVTNARNQFTQTYEARAAAKAAR